MLKSKYITLLMALFIAFLVVGCGEPKPLYVYNDYNDKYYAFKKNLDSESMLELQKSIEEAIANVSNSKSGRVAPGMYANLGYIYLKQGNAKKALENFKKEKATYPEAAHFMDRMIKKVELAEGK